MKTRVIESITSVIDSFTRVNPSITSVIDSFKLVSQVTQVQSSGPFTLAIESITRVIDSKTSVSQVIQNQSSSCCRVSERTRTQAESITGSQQGGGGPPPPCVLCPAFCFSIRLRESKPASSCLPGCPTRSTESSSARPPPSLPCPFPPPRTACRRSPSASRPRAAASSRRPANRA